MSETFETIDPANGEPIKRYTFMNAEESEAVVEKCHQAFESWRKKSPTDRAKVIAGIGKPLQEHKEELSQLMTREMGKLLQQSRDEVDLCAGICEWTADNGPAQLEPEERELEDGSRGLISYQPIGVVYGIQPWNYPAYQVVRYSIANLMAGNGVLLKHAQSVTGTGELLAQVYKQGGLPEDLFAPLIIDKEQSEKVIKNKRVRGVTLTGSPEAGRIVGQQAAAELKKTVLELGSNDAYLVLEDADVELAVKTCVKGRIYNNGETCIAAKRFVVTEPVYDEFCDGFVKAMKAIKFGDPTGDEADIGPMAREDLRETLHEQVEKSVAAGARVLCGGKMPDGEGYYYPATVLAEVAPGQPAYDDELFGPVASLIRAHDADDAMRIANDSRFGLGGGIITRDEDKAVRMATERFDTGMVFINGFGLAAPDMPFGGVKNSGYGREHGGFGIREFVNVKAVVLKNSDA